LNRDPLAPGLPSWLSPLLIFLVVVAGYGIAPGRLPLKGEETCRALHGIEMARTGDWLVATNQGVPILDRPPLQYWTFAVIHRWIHDLDPLTLRLFMAAVTLGTSLLIWWYSRRFLPEAAALLAAVAYPTTFHVFDLGRRVETDGLFTLFMAGSLLLWHHGYSQRWRPLWTWTAGAAVAALATLTKGTQGPVTFFGTLYLFLLLRRDWRYLFCWSHLLGILLFLSLIGVWQVPFYLEKGWEGTRMTWLDPYSSRVDTEFTKVLLHLFKFPLEMLGASLPWCVLLVGLFHPRFWKMEEGMRSTILFLLLGMAVIFAPVWLSEGGSSRYAMPIYPLMAVLYGAVARQCWSPEASGLLRLLWRGYARIMAVVVAGFVAVFLTATIAAGFSDALWIQSLRQPWAFLIGMALCAAAGVGALFRWTSSSGKEHPLPVALLIALLLCLGYNGAIMNILGNTSVQLGPEVAALRQKLGGARLVSFAPLHHRFLYYYGEAIPIESEKSPPDDMEYFAVRSTPALPPDLPFPWEKIAEFSMDWRIKPEPYETIIVGRRIGEH